MITRDRSGLGDGKAVLLALGLMVSSWCLIVLYVVIAVRVLDIMYPLGRSVVATMIYSLLFMDPYFPSGGKLDLPVGLVHAFGLYKSMQYLWRQGRS